MICRIEDAFSLIRNGANIKQGMDDTGYPITRIETISNRVVDRNKMGYAGIHDLIRYADYILEDGDILMSHINSEAHLGKVAIYEKYPNETIIHGMNLLCLRPKRKIIDSRYAFYYLSSDRFLRQIPRITKKSVNQASFTVTALKELEIIIVSMERQREIVSILDKIGEIIALRKKQLAKNDEMVKSRFIEMFGDPISNPMEWDMIPLGKRCDIITGNTPPRADSENYGEYIEWIKSDNINTPSTYITKAEECLSEKGFAICRFVESGSLLMTCIAGSVNCIGNVAVTNRRVAFNQQINAVVPTIDEVLYLYWLIQLSKPAIHSTINKALKGILSKGQLSEMRFPFPPVALQQQFADFVQATDKSKLAIQKSLDELETLKKALMQKYFG